VTCVHTQADAMMLAKSNHVDLFLINRGRGDSAAASFCREMRTAFASTPVIVYSTVASAAEKQEVLGAGALRYLSTPAELLDLAEISSSLFSGRQSIAA